MINATYACDSGQAEVLCIGTRLNPSGARLAANRRGTIRREGKNPTWRQCREKPLQPVSQTPELWFGRHLRARKKNPGSQAGVGKPFCCHTSRHPLREEKRGAANRPAVI